MTPIIEVTEEENVVTPIEREVVVKNSDILIKQHQ